MIRFQSYKWANVNLYHVSSISHVIRYQDLGNSISHWNHGDRPAWMINICFWNTKPCRVRSQSKFHLIPQSPALLSCSLTTLDHNVSFPLVDVKLPIVTSLHKYNPPQVSPAPSSLYEPSIWKFMCYPWHHVTISISIWSVATTTKNICIDVPFYPSMCSIQHEHSLLPGMWKALDKCLMTDVTNNCTKGSLSPVFSFE